MENEQIRDMPILIDNSHESVLRAYQILEKVKEMIKRKDSLETISEIIKFCENGKE